MSRYEELVEKCETRARAQLTGNLECKTLAEIKIGQRAKVVGLLVKGSTRRRLLDLGLLPGTEVRAVMKSPLETPIAYDIRGSMLALRLEDASKVVVKPLSLPCDEEGN